LQTSKRVIINNEAEPIVYYVIQKGESYDLPASLEFGLLPCTTHAAGGIGGAIICCCIGCSSSLESLIFCEDIDPAKNGFYDNDNLQWDRLDYFIFFIKC